MNSERSVPITIADSRKNRTMLLLESVDKSQKTISKGSGDIIVDGQTVLKDFTFRAGAAYTINVYNDSNLFVSGLALHAFYRCFTSRLDTNVVLTCTYYILFE